MRYRRRCRTRTSTSGRGPWYQGLSSLKSTLTTIPILSVSHSFRGRRLVSSRSWLRTSRALRPRLTTIKWRRTSLSSTRMVSRSEPASTPYSTRMPETTKYPSRNCKKKLTKIGLQTERLVQLMSSSWANRIMMIMTIFSMQVRPAARQINCKPSPDLALS